MKILLLASALLLPTLALAATPDPNDAARQLGEARMLADSLKYQTGVIPLRGDLATVTVADGYRYLGPADTETVLAGIWRNPAQHDLLGMIVPAAFDPIRSGSWAVVITYVGDGYVKDDDAAKIDYGDLMTKMQDGAAAENKTRVANGYPPIQLVGWAATPRYDASTHKLYWAKEIKFGDIPQHTLNYNIRILGRSGVLVLNAVAGMPQLRDVERATPTLLSMVDFKPGNRYADFNRGTDKVATYGIAALVAGGIAAKVGIFKGIWVAILALKKFIIIGALAVSRWFSKWWNKLTGREPSKKAASPTASLEPPAGSA